MFFLERFRSSKDFEAAFRSTLHKISSIPVFKSSSPIFQHRHVILTSLIKTRQRLKARPCNARHIMQVILWLNYAPGLIHSMNASCYPPDQTRLSPFHLSSFSSKSRTDLKLVMRCQANCRKASAESHFKILLISSSLHPFNTSQPPSPHSSFQLFNVPKMRTENESIPFQTHLHWYLLLDFARLHCSWESPLLLSPSSPALPLTNFNRI